VKEFLSQRSGRAPQVSRHAPAVSNREPAFAPLSRKPIIPADAEVLRNPRARSAKMRVAERTGAPAAAADPESLLPPLHLSRAYSLRNVRS
jgi:16S rRNA (cytosine1402-N4)-methyltransferase